MWLPGGWLAKMGYLRSRRRIVPRAPTHHGGSSPDAHRFLTLQFCAPCFSRPCVDKIQGFTPRPLAPLAGYNQGWETLPPATDSEPRQDVRPVRSRRSSIPLTHASQRHSQYCHHRPRRPRQDDAGRLPAAPKRRVPRQPAGRRLHPRLQRSGARAGHHDPGQEHRHPLPGREDQPDRHARPRRLWRRGGARAADGRRRPGAGRRRRRARCRKRGSCSPRRSSAGCSRSW